MPEPEKVGVDAAFFRYSKYEFFQIEFTIQVCHNEYYTYQCGKNADKEVRGCYETNRIHWKSGFQIHSGES